MIFEIVFTLLEHYHELCIWLCSLQSYVVLDLEKSLINDCQDHHHPPVSHPLASPPTTSESVFDLFLRELHFNDLGQKNYYYLCQEVNPK